jgi:hypothetical protein
MALSLKIDLEARFAQALDAFDKLEKQAGRSMNRIESAARGVNTALAAIGVGVSVGALARSFKSAVDELASLKDASEQTGSSIETISSALNTLRETGTGGLETVLELTDRFGRAISTVDKDTSRAAAAFKQLGLDIDQLKSLGRADAVLEIARAQAQFADDGQKAALVEAALGRGAARLIPQLNELANATRGSAGALTESARQADVAAKAISAFQARLIAFRNDIAIKVLPVLTTFYNRARAFQEIGSNNTDFFDSLFGDDKALQARANRTEETINRLREAQAKLIDERDKALKAGRDPSKPSIGGAVGRAGALPLGDAFGIAGSGADRGVSIDQQLNKNNRQLQELGLQLGQQKALLERRKAISAEFSEVAPSRPSIDGAGLFGGGEPGAGDRERLNEADKLLRKTIEQLVATEGLTEVGRLELQAALAGYPQKVAGAEALAFGLARQIDLVNELRESERRATEQRQRAAAAALANIAAVDRAEQDADEAIRRDIESIRDAVDPTRALYRELERVRDLTSAGLIPADIGNARLLTLYSEIDRILLDIPQAAAEAQDSISGLLAPIESAFERILLQGGKARDILAGLANDIAQFIIRSQITGPLFEILGGKATGKSVGGTLLGSLLGFANGGDPPVGRWSLVGEKGPELIRPLSPMRVYPNGMGPAGGGGGVVVNQNISVGAGVNRAEVAAAMYAAKESAKAEILASMRRGSTFAAA